MKYVALQAYGKPSFEERQLLSRFLQKETIEKYDKNLNNEQLIRKVTILLEIAKFLYDFLLQITSPKTFSKRDSVQ